MKEPFFYSVSLAAIASLAINCNGHGHHYVTAEQSAKSSPLPLRPIKAIIVMEETLRSWRVHAGEVLVGFMEVLEIREGSLRLMVFP